MRKLLISTIISLACVAPAMAQDAQTPAASPASQDQTAPKNPASSPAPQNQTTAAQQQQDTGAGRSLENALRTRLARAGLTDIEMLPTSFLVRAKDADGNSVMLMLGPEPVAEDLQVDPQGNPGGDTGRDTPDDEDEF